VLPAAHALSGCITASSFFGIDKKSVYKILKDAAPDFHDLGNLGDPDKTNFQGALMGYFD
jgi:hypothetical protein